MWLMICIGGGIVVGLAAAHFATSASLPRIPRTALALLAVLLLSVPSAIGVQHALAPTRGVVAGWLAAAGFELVYLSTAILSLTPALRTYAQRVALSAVATAIVLNTIADYSQRVPLGLANAAKAYELFDGLALGLSLVESVPLAGLAYAMAALLHRLSEQERHDAQDQSLDAQVIDKLAQERAHLADRVAQLTADVAQAVAMNAQSEQDARNQAQIVRMQSEEIAQLRAATALDPLAIAQALRDRDVPWRAVAELVRMPESTLRNQLQKAAKVAA